MSNFKITWHDLGREPQCSPNPNFPKGIDLDVAGDSSAACSTDLPYPAKRCGFYRVKCEACGFLAIITTAGRPDDPRSVKLPCKLPTEGIN